MQYCIELEANLASLGDHGALTNARRLYDSVLDLYPQEREVWRNYFNLELKVRPHITTIYILPHFIKG
jgi:U3 small nucleolar RNA-associated protein 6